MYLIVCWSVVFREGLISQRLTMTETDCWGKTYTVNIQESTICSYSARYKHYKFQALCFMNECIIFYSIMQATVAGRLWWWVSRHYKADLFLPKMKWLVYFSTVYFVTLNIIILLGHGRSRKLNYSIVIFLLSWHRWKMWITKPK